MMMYLAAVFWCFTIFSVVAKPAAAATAADTKSRELHQDSSQNHHRITKKGGKSRLPVPVIFDTDYGPFIDDGMFVVNAHFCLLSLSHYVVNLVTFANI